MTGYFEQGDIRPKTIAYHRSEGDDTPSHIHIIRQGKLESLDYVAGQVQHKLARDRIMICAEIVCISDAMVPPNEQESPKAGKRIYHITQVRGARARYAKANQSERITGHLDIEEREAEYNVIVESWGEAIYRTAFSIETSNTYVNATNL
jgi:hypothetical protein